MGRTRRTLWTLAAGLATIITASVATSALAGCENTAPERTAAQRAAATRTAALTGYRKMWDAFAEAGKTADPDAPALREYAIGDALDTITSTLSGMRDGGTVILGDLKIDPEVVSLEPLGDPTVATVSDCVDDENWREHKASGGLANDTPGGRHRTTATVDLAIDWKVSSLKIEAPGTC
jgi:hypothetical protein